MLPAYFANMAPVLTKGHFKELKVPLDLNTKLDNYTIFGRHKTFRGLVFGVILALIMAFFQYLLYGLEFFKLVSFADYSNWLLIGLLFGIGAIFGDLAESFVKRRLNIKPGKSFVPWDQLDFVIGSLIFIYPLAGLWLSPAKIATIIILSFVLHIMVNHIAHHLKIRKEKW
jgi:CDP-2,3-bis-(O-geranylgeranyl)-sn-glycerol synthase